MSYVKVGVVTKIEILKNEKESTLYLKNLLNFDLYDKKNNCYFIKKSVLNNNIYNFRKEFLRFVNNRGDSMSDYEAYYLNTDVNNLLNNLIVFEDSYEKYYFENHKDFVFSTDSICYSNKKVFIKLHFIAIFWDINKIIAEDFSDISLLINNLIRFSINNCLKNASWCAIV